MCLLPTAGLHSISRLCYNKSFHSFVILFHTLTHFTFNGQEKMRKGMIFLLRFEMEFYGLIFFVLEFEKQMIENDDELCDGHIYFYFMMDMYVQNTAQHRYLANQ